MDTCCVALRASRPLHIWCWWCGVGRAARCICSAPPPAPVFWARWGVVLTTRGTDRRDRRSGAALSTPTGVVCVVVLAPPFGRPAGGPFCSGPLGASPGTLCPVDIPAPLLMAVVVSAHFSRLSQETFWWVSVFAGPFWKPVVAPGPGVQLRACLPARADCVSGRVGRPPAEPLLRPRRRA